MQLGQAYALLRAGCAWMLDRSMDGGNHTIWVRIKYKGFGHFDHGGQMDSELFYLPSESRLDDANGRDWY